MTHENASGGAAILVVDDKPEKLLALKAVLSGLGEEIVEARSGREALRLVLGREFAVILLDVDMPIMDGFETAALIRQRKFSEHTPIIFVTAYSDDTHVARGYSLGAVDYIVQPVVPEVLRSKIGVFVDLFRKTALIRAQADTLAARAGQLQRLTRASLAINGALSVEALLRAVAESARDLLGAHESAVESLERDGSRATRTFVATAGGTAERRSSHHIRRLPPFPDGAASFADAGRRTLAARIRRRDGSPLGAISVTRPTGGEFDAGDEALLVSLAQTTAIAVENAFSNDLREANRFKDEFLSTLSHELRTPLSAVLGWTRLLRASRSDPARFEHGLDVVERNSLSLARMVEDLLDISRITLGKLALAPGVVNLRELVESAVDGMQPAALAKGLALSFHARPGLGDCRVSGDPERLHQVLRNLLSNATKFTPWGGHVYVTVERERDVISVAVSDDGEGISPVFLGAVFDRFRQADGSSARVHGGLGIGLGIVRHLVEAHGGTVEAESRGEGCGATFTVRLPAAGDAGTGGVLSAVDAPGRDLAGIRVLLVEDDPDGREAIAEILFARKADVTPAGSLAEALARLEPSHDVLVSDIGMPGGDGYELLARVRELPPERGGAVPAIALTAYVRPEDRRRALDAGFHDHVTKPVDPAALVAAIHYLSRASRDDARGASPLSIPENQ